VPEKDYAEWMPVKAGINNRAARPPECRAREIFQRGRVPACGHPWASGAGHRKLPQLGIRLQVRLLRTYDKGA
jgi:hypothetical protein